MGFFPRWVNGLWPLIQVDPYLWWHKVSVTRWITVPACWSKGLDQAEWRRDAIRWALIQMIHVFGAKAQNFRDAYVRVNVRGRAGSRSMWVLIFFLYGSLLIIIIIWRSDAIQQWSNTMDHDGSTWIIKPTSALGFMIQMSRTIYVTSTMDQVGSRVFSPVESRAYDLWSNLIHGCKDTCCPIILPHYELWSNCTNTLDHIS